ncbi:sn-glycerol-3-phosphate ABC transporter ATP-binding protein UgpC (plasmid) [Agrobacterium leguminum]|uniref:ABC transporter ATP-binding protein n=1 Tax=Agrobacterium deltaense NCPPB 1641 TaxID=1183425 RepID=A0A1S7U8T4_9HYPH|nr:MULTISPECIES: sn-glycerol-3-phosphate ABC transporter ATP-binding protein UgpC [Agrobacterium]WFS70043.1 sn-glycerol-3-phosphate ABC transporter ATP-binding protein UgpC [Agrobacterium leguminum]CVI63336.1 ABC transporter ATP-binding protein [Agrobacterium deltaense NCPPB 1641]
MASLSMHSVKKSYGALQVLHGVDIDVRDGEFVILVGPSGCGKSTLLRMIAGLESITAGTMKIGSKLVNNLPPKSRDIAMVFQSYALYPHMTVAENMAFSLKLKRRPKSEIDAAVSKAADILALTELLDRTPKELSGGQRQRVAMGRAIVRNPAVFLFDEPLSNLDAKLRVQMRSEIKELHQRLGTTIIYVTHDQVEAMTMADRIVVMNRGNVEQVGPPLELYDQPRNLFVASFIGSPGMNLIKGAMTEEGTFSTEEGARIEVPHLSHTHDRKIVLGIRPEHLEIVAPETPGSFSAEVAVTEPTGSETQVTFRIKGRELVGIFHERLLVAPGETLHLKPFLNRAHLFDAETGNRMG